MCLIYFSNETGAPTNAVPYRGAAPAMQDLLAGTIDLFCPEAGQTLPQFRAGSIKAFAVLTEKRWFAAPDVPTIDEAGVPGLHFPFWHGLWAPRGIPPEALAKLNAAVVAALADPAARKRFHDLGHEVRPTSRPRRASPSTTRPRPTSGGRSSRRPTSRRSEALHSINRPDAAASRRHHADAAAA
jgi:tripartite-type tricarboxylate transporter receptor subunit TctC